MRHSPLSFLSRAAIIFCETLVDIVALNYGYPSTLDNVRREALGVRRMGQLSTQHWTESIALNYRTDI